MIRRLLVLLAVAIATGAALASTASAEIEPVHVEVENDEEMIEMSGENTLAFQSQIAPGIWSTVIECDNHWEATVSEDGVVHVHDIVIGQTAGSTQNCLAIDDCGSEWPGQIFEDETTGDAKIHLVFCFTLTGAGEFTCDVHAMEMHCNDALLTGTADVRVTGELDFDHGISVTDVE